MNPPGHANIQAYLEDWMTRYQLPFTVAVCPQVVEQQSVFWWEELAARFAFSSNQKIHITVKEENHTIDSSNELVALAAKLNNQQRLGLIQQLRHQTNNVSQDSLMASDYVHRNMNWSQLTKLNDNPLCTVAAHALEHEISTSLTSQELLTNAVQCREILQQKLETEIVDFVYPNGAYSAETDVIILRAGYRRYFSLNDRINPGGTSSGNLSRIRGYGKGTENLRYYEHVWQRRHSASGEVEQDTATAQY